MKKLLLLLGLIFCASHAQAACGTITAGMNQSQVDSAISLCSSGQTATFPAGTYGPWTSVYTIPCGVNLSGPTVPYSQTPNQTATLDGSSSFAGWSFQTTVGCSATQTIQYIEWDGKQPNNGGGFLYVEPGTTNLVIQNNWLHGVQSYGADSTEGQAFTSDLILLDGSSSGTTTSNITIQNNIFGSTSFSDCSIAMNDTNSGEVDNGGLCGGVGVHNNIANVYILNNIFHWLEQPMKTYEGQGACNNMQVNYNWYYKQSRIQYETQCNIGTSSQPTYMTVDYNVWGNQYGVIQTYDASIANGCSNTLNQYCESRFDYNVEVQATNVGDVGTEFWGGSPTNPANTSGVYSGASYNLWQGYLYDAMTYAKAGNFIFNNNTFNVVNNGTNTDCTVGAGGFWKVEDSPTYTPSCSGNTFSNAITGTVTSALPSVSPAGGSGPFSPGATITIATSGTNRDTNTSNWCTTDGTTPVAGGNAASTGNTATIMTSYTLPSSGTATLSCLGMWGAVNQPYSYPTNFGYVPSSVVTNSYPIGGGTTVAPPGVSVIVISEIPSQKIITHADGPNGQNYRVAVVVPEQPVTISIPSGCASGLYLFGLTAGKFQPVCYTGAVQ